ncbi:hypothetical protein Pcar_0006 [Syntrophotalea carbinolica DSM 2380]|uniref:Uncharacterized protein n=1 Tax=Syntrophotalea carbinolica (strain DSM 2380 / NBRC 103641 / GraBd1) TaxID=338963 RepID=Q3A8M3_SYNC1|nr:hypothetical protein Pcar_0006 [Syntrophotalea carbinolica DSM 2380]
MKEERARARKTSNKRRYLSLAGAGLLLAVLIGWYAMAVNRGDMAQKLYRRAEKHIEKGAYRTAVSQLRSLHDHYPATETGARALLLAGDILLLHLRQDQEALLSFLLVERDYPDTAWSQRARRQVADIYKYRLQDYGRALVAYQKILDGPSTQREIVQYEIADTYFRMNNFEQTRIEFESLINEYPESSLLPEALYRIGCAFMLEGNLSDAVQVLQRLCRDYPEHSFALEGYFTLAEIHEERGELRKALQVLAGLEGRYAREPILAQRITQVQNRIRKKKKAI